MNIYVETKDGLYYEVIAYNKGYNYVVCIDEKEHQTFYVWIDEVKGFKIGVDNK